MSTFTDQMYDNAATSSRGLVTGPLDAPLRRSWGEVHDQARRIAGSLANAGVGPGSAVAVLAGDPADVAPLAQAVWMRGASLTMLQQPTPRTDLAIWLADTNRAATMIRAALTVVGPPFARGGRAALRGGATSGYRRRAPDRTRNRTAAPGRVRGRDVSADLRVHRHPQGGADHPREPAGELRRLGHRSRRRCEHRRDGHLAAPVPRHGHDRIPHRPDAARHRARRHHPRPIPASPGAVAGPDHPLPRHHHLRTQLRLCATRPDPGTRRTGPLRPVQPARRDQRRRTHRRPRRASCGSRRVLASGCALGRSPPPTAWPRPPSPSPSILPRS